MHVNFIANLIKCSFFPSHFRYANFQCLLYYRVGPWNFGNGSILKANLIALKIKICEISKRFDKNHSIKNAVHSNLH